MNTPICVSVLIVMMSSIPQTPSATTASKTEGGSVSGTQEDRITSAFKSEIQRMITNVDVVIPGSMEDLIPVFKRYQHIIDELMDLLKRYQKIKANKALSEWGEESAEGGQYDMTTFALRSAREALFQQMEYIMTSSEKKSMQDRIRAVKMHQADIEAVQDIFNTYTSTNTILRELPEGTEPVRQSDVVVFALKAQTKNLLDMIKRSITQSKPSMHNRIKAAKKHQSDIQVVLALLMTYTNANTLMKRLEKDFVPGLHYDMFISALKVQMNIWLKNIMNIFSQPGIPMHDRINAAMSFQENMDDLTALLNRCEKTKTIVFSS